MRETERQVEFTPRTACQWILDVVMELRERNPKVVDCVRSAIDLIERYATDGVNAPTRNCDVGTAEEHAQRFYNFCESNSSGINGMCKPTCPCIDCFDKCQCFAKWAQMPYEDEEGGAK